MHNNPFYYKDTMQLIMRACLDLGPVQARKLSRTCRLAAVALDYYWAEYIKLGRMHRLILNGEYEPNRKSRYDAWAAYVWRKFDPSPCPRVHLNDFIVRSVLKYNGLAIRWMSQPTTRDWEVAIGRDSLAVGHLDRFIVGNADQLCWQALRQDRRRILDIPYRMRTREMYDYASHDKSLVAQFPRGMITQQRIFNAIMCCVTEYRSEKALTRLLEMLKWDMIPIHADTWYRLFTCIGEPPVYAVHLFQPTDMWCGRYAATGRLDGVPWRHRRMCAEYEPM